MLKALFLSSSADSVRRSEVVDALGAGPVGIAGNPGGDSVTGVCGALSPWARSSAVTASTSIGLLATAVDAPPASAARHGSLAPGGRRSEDGNASGDGLDGFAKNPAGNGASGVGVNPSPPAKDSNVTASTPIGLSAIDVGVPLAFAAVPSSPADDSNLSEEGDALSAGLDGAAWNPVGDGTAGENGALGPPANGSVGYRVPGGRGSPPALPVEVGLAADDQGTAEVGDATDPGIVNTPLQQTSVLYPLFHTRTTRNRRRSLPAAEGETRVAPRVSPPLVALAVLPVMAAGRDVVDVPPAGGTTEGVAQRARSSLPIRPVLEAGRDVVDALPTSRTTEGVAQHARGTSQVAVSANYRGVRWSGNSLRASSEYGVTLK